MVRKARPSDRDGVAAMRHLLWPDASAERHAREFDVSMTRGTVGTTPEAIFIAEDSSGALIGFLDVDLRSHADGCDPSRPVGYVEGWYVREPFRNQRVGRRLLAAAEEWAREYGCREMASDTWIDNQHSQLVHDALGFEVVDRCVHYRKQIAKP